MLAFFSRFPELGARETRTLNLTQTVMGIPPGQYALVQFYCEDPKCDCRRTIIQIWEERNPGVALATFNFGWESKEFYTDWLHGDAKSGEQICGLSLEPGGQQSRLTDPLRAMVEMVLQDPAYVERLKRHYAMFKQPSAKG